MGKLHTVVVRGPTGLAFARSLETGRKGPGRPTIDDLTLRTDRDAIVWLLAVAWGDIGWQLPRATTLEELRTALEPLRGHANEQYVTVFLRPTFVVSTAEEVRAERKDLAKAIEDCRLTREHQDKCLADSRTAEFAMNDAEPEQQGMFFVELLRGWRDSATARKDREVAEKEEKNLDKDLRAKEAGFALSELLDFITQKKYARNPLRLANAMAGLPDIGWAQSYARCSAIKCASWPQFQFRLFRTIKAIWNRRVHHPDLTPAQLFRQEIEALPKTVIIVIPQPPPDPPKKGKMENALRSHLADNWRLLRLAIEDVAGLENHPDQIPFLLLACFIRNIAKPRTAQDLVLIAKEKIST
jgi:hypothetical protein